MATQTGSSAGFLPPCPPGIPKPTSSCTLQGSSKELGQDQNSRLLVGTEHGAAPQNTSQSPGTQIPLGCTPGERRHRLTADPAQKQQSRHGSRSPKARSTQMPTGRHTGVDHGPGTHREGMHISRNEADPHATRWALQSSHEDRASGESPRRASGSTQGRLVHRGRS